MSRANKGQRNKAAQQAPQVASAEREFILDEKGKLVVTDDEVELFGYLGGETPSNTGGVTRRGRSLGAARILPKTGKLLFYEALSQLWPGIRTKPERKERFASWYATVTPSEEVASYRIEHWEKEGMPRRVYMQAFKEIPGWWARIRSEKNTRTRSPRDSEGRFIQRFTKKGRIRKFSIAPHG